MAKYRKKPMIVEAYKWKLSWADNPHGVYWDMSQKQFYVVTIHKQRAYLSDGDWIITEPDGIHYYPCKPDIFEATYEKVFGE